VQREKREKNRKKRTDTYGVSEIQEKEFHYLYRKRVQRKRENAFKKKNVTQEYS